ncbi:uncharacterized protein MELLADRAFT_103446 [Melampsora larici-populina 98AG31]|uniref:Uncharacterized protein n=1 Tax=Melampsora larici-populina (strain 98AG31 / pathotype 3-4-7) TaxID=747676 RepID=F4RBH4_MELLP|nr:uncharacterized protein MELLADRAFT_103446 [Melampsora larici-populina 98AG31]EGG10086.1 hypothetical protein MELLADRAFT_103446 [Melampsora larici-populina 98AG31]
MAAFLSLMVEGSRALNGIKLTVRLLESEKTAAEVLERQYLFKKKSLTYSSQIAFQKATESTNTVVFPVTHEQLVNRMKNSKQIQEEVKKQYGSSSTMSSSPPIPEVEPHPRNSGHFAQKEVVVPVSPPIQNSVPKGENKSMVPGASLQPNTFQRTKKRDMMIAACLIFRGMFLGWWYQTWAPDFYRLVYGNSLI